MDESKRKCIFCKYIDVKRDQEPCIGCFKNKADFKGKYHGGDYFEPYKKTNK